MLNIPFVQHEIGVGVSHLLSEKLKTQVTIGRINLGLFNRIIIDDIQINDQGNHELLTASRFSAKFEILPLFQSRIVVHSVQFFGFNIRLNKVTPQSKPNYQFLVDALSPKKKSTQPSNLEFHIYSIIMRRGRFNYDIFSKPQTPDKFNASHIRVHNISATFAIRTIQKDSLNFGIKRLSFDDESGLSIDQLTFKLNAGKKKMTVDDLELDLQNSSISTDRLTFNYDSLGAFKNFKNQVTFNLRTKPSYINLHDISMFVPAFKNFKDRVNISVSAQGTLDHFVLSRLNIDAGRKMQIKMNGSARGLLNKLSQYSFYINTTQLFVNEDGMNFIIRNFVKNGGKIPGILMSMGDISFSGQIAGQTSRLNMNGIFRTSGGMLKTNIALGHPDQATYTCYGQLFGTNIDMGKITGDKKWGSSTFNLQVNATKKEKVKFPTVMLKGLVSTLNYNNYSYNNININGLLDNTGFRGMANINDENGVVRLHGNAELMSGMPKIDLDVYINKFRPYNLRLTNKYKNSAFSVHVKANVRGKNIDDLTGKVDIDSLSITSPQNSYFLRNMHITSTLKDKQKFVDMKSEIADATFEGNFKYTTLGSSVKNIISQYLPSLIKPMPKRRSDNHFKFDAIIYNTELLSALFDIPVQIDISSRIKGYIDEATNRMEIEGFVPSLKYNGKEYQSGYFFCENPSDKIHALLRFNQMRKNGAVTYSLNSIAKNDTLNSSLTWGNNTKETYSGALQTQTHFMKSEDNTHLKALLKVNPSNVIVNDTVWQVNPSVVTVDRGIIDIKNFLINHNDRFIHIDGKVSPLPTDTVKVGLKDINLTYIFNILNFDDVDFKGEVSGNVNVSNTTKNPHLNGLLSVRNFTFNDGPLGDGNILASWDNEHQGVALDARLSEPNTSHTHVTGFIYPLKPKSGLDLEIDANNTNIKFVERFTRDIFKELDGRVTGKAHLFGKFSELNLNTQLTANAKAKVGILNTSFVLKDSIIMTPTDLRFTKAKIFDSEGHEGTATGLITFKYLKNFNYRIQLNFSNMLIMNTHETEDMPFYGKIYATGSTMLQGGSNKGLDITAALTTDKNSTFVYINRSTTSAINNQFITFIDKTPRRDVDSVEVIDPLDAVMKNISGDIRLNLQVNATPDATLKIIMDPIAGDNIIAHGSGNIRGDYYNKGNFKMFGTYTINQGEYKFSLQQVIRKNFTLKSGSTIAFNGAPLDATLNMLAVYTVNSASLSDLIPTASQIVKQTNIKVNCLMNLTGNLPHPTISFNLELPNEQDEIQTLVRNYISTDEQMNTQVLYLLSIGKFFTQDNTNTTQNSNMMSSVLSSTISGQLNNILSQINIKNWNFGTNLSTGQNGWTDMEVEGILSGRLLNNRLLVNGNFGYRDNALSNSSFIGDFEAELLLNRTGSIRLKAYNETNDRYYTKTNLTTQGVGIIVQRDFDKWSELFFWNRWKLKALKINNSRKKEEEEKK